MIGRSLASAMRRKWVSAISGDWPSVNGAGGNTSSAEAPPALAMRAMRAASRLPSAHTPLTSGSRLPLVNGVWADGSLEAARIARMASAGGASALLVFPPAPFTLGQSPEMALTHFRRIADASDLPIIVFQYPLATGQGY